MHLVHLIRIIELLYVN